MKSRLILSLCVAFCALVGEGCATVGSSAKLGDTQLTNPSPTILNIEDQQKKGTATGVGPASYDSVRDDGVQSISAGLNASKVFVRRTSDGAVTASFTTGKDTVVKNTTVNPKTGAISIGEVTTSASEPIRAHNEAYAPLVAYWATRDEKSQAVILGFIDAVDKNLGSIFRKAIGVP